MPFLARDLLQGHDKPVTITSDEPVQQALNLMVAHDYSQLPVIAADATPLGLITSDSILRALSYFGADISALHVSDAIARARTYREDEDLFELLGGLRDAYAVLIVNDELRLRGIVTNYDTTEYFRRRAQDMMVVEDIEAILKDFIQAIFSDDDGTLNIEQLDAAICDIADTDAELYKQFKKAIGHYIGLVNKSNPGLKLDTVELVFDMYLRHHGATKSLDDLTFREYIGLLLYKSKAQRVRSIFEMEPEALDKMLNNVRETRNVLAHFRGEISSEQRDQIRFCKEWLSRRKSAWMVRPRHASQIRNAISDSTSVASESRYELLVKHLDEQPIDRDPVQLTFTEIEAIIGDKLPESARQHQSWWSSFDAYPVQQWLDAGWRISAIDTAEERAAFSRMKGFKRLHHR